MLNFSITVVQFIGGLVSNSLSLLSDALHNLGDSSALLIAFVAGKISGEKPNQYKTFGYKRVEILAALFNAVVLIAICIFLFYKAYQRFANPEPIKGQVMFIIAVFGLLANLVSVWILHDDKAHNLNIRAAYLHLLGDTLSSIAVILGAVAVWKYHIYWLDPVITVLVGVYIFWHTWAIIKQTLSILMQSVPTGIDMKEIKNRIEKIKEIKDIHHVHIWKLDDKQIHFEAHINLKEDISISDVTVIRERVEQLLKKQFGFYHITLQMEYECCHEDCELISKTKR